MKEALQNKYHFIKKELLKVMLEGQTSGDLSRRLGYSFDQVGRWQRGVKELRWEEFCDLCQALNLPLLPSAITLLRRPDLQDEDLYQIAPLLKGDLQRDSLAKLQQQLGVPSATFKRYMRGDVSPSVEFVFALIDQNSNLLGSFLTSLVGKTRISHIHELFQSSESQVQVSMFWPLGVAIEGLLNIEEYKKQPEHSESWFCEKLGVSPEEFREVWQVLVDSGRVQAQGQKFGITYETINTVGATPEQVCKMVDFWTKRAQARFDRPNNKPLRKSEIPGFVAYRVVPMSKATSMEAIEILNDAYRKILALAENSSGPYEDVRVFLLHNFSVLDYEALKPLTKAESKVQGAPPEAQEGP